MLQQLSLMQMLQPQKTPNGFDAQTVGTQQYQVH
jgi:hypothetical protein